MKPLRSKEYPTSHLLNPRREYVRSHMTDITQTFERVRREQKRQQTQQKRKTQ